MGKNKKPTTIDIVMMIASIVSTLAAIISAIRWW